MRFFHPNQYLAQNPEATALEGMGLQASLAGSQEAARDHYAQALALVPNGDTPDAAAQRGSILRNLGFSYVREGIAARSTEAFAQGTTYLRDALAETALYASGARNLNYQKIGPHATYKKPRRELLSAHAATLGLLGRAATAQEVALGIEPSAETTQGRLRYGFAHDFARLGTNGYFRVSNSMNLARDERIHGRRIHAAVCVARAAFGIVWSVKNDRGNLKNGVRTFARRLIDLRSISASRQSVLVRP